MCGIVGVAWLSDKSPVTLSDVRRMANAIAHRGPDDEGFYESNAAIIGMRRLSIIDLSGGHQPIANEDETLWLVCNGEIYNFKTLRDQLIKNGHKFRTKTDVEVILHLYEQYGDDFLQHITGMYSLALWDVRRRRLVLARDRMGQKPLYYHYKDGRLAFGSELKSLLQLAFVGTELDMAALSEYLSMGYVTAPNTLFTNIKKLPPGHKLVLEQDGLNINEYWQLPTEVKAGKDKHEWAELIRNNLDRAVSEHMISDVPIGAFLSGGVDSSLIVSFMAKNSSRPINTYSVGYVGGSAEKYYNELSYAKQIANQFGTHHTEITVQPQMAQLLPKLLWHVEEPISDSAMLTTFLVSQLASQSVKVILSGVGGDELFAGYRRYLGGYYNQYYRRIPSWIRNSVLSPMASLLPSGRQSKLMDLSRYIRRYIQASQLDWRAQYRMYSEIAGREQVQHLMCTSHSQVDRFDAVLELERSNDELLRLLRVDAKTQLSEDLLLLTDKVTMAASIECRAPFLDHKLVELAAEIPAALKIPKGDLKGLLKFSLENVLPHEILQRSKRGFGAPVGSWLKKDLLPLRNRLLSKSVIESRGLLNWSSVQQIIWQHESSRQDYSDLLFVLLNLELWCRMFLDGRTFEDLGAEMMEWGQKP